MSLHRETAALTPSIRFDLKEWMEDVSVPPKAEEVPFHKASITRRGGVD